MDRNIAWADVFIAYITPTAFKSEKMNTDISNAHKAGKRIVGVWNSTDCRIPTALDEYGDALVPLDDDKLVIDAINGLDVWVKPNGEDAYRQIPRYKGR